MHSLVCYKILTVFNDRTIAYNHRPVFKMVGGTGMASNAVDVNVLPFEI